MSRDTTIDFLKGLAILAVIGLHIIPFFVNSENVNTERSRNLLTVMNYFRFAVPFFVALSGVALAKKYLMSPLAIGDFLRNRIGKLIPQYLFWIGVIYLIVHIVPGWAGFSDSFPLWQVIFLGRGEYHLYFIPMIISLYLLFPILFWLTRKCGIFFVFGILLLQVWFYWYLGNVVIHDITVKSLQTDQQQYVFLGSWIFYFVLGIYIGLRNLQGKLIVGLLSLPLFAIGVRWTVLETQELLLKGYNIIYASGFTRISVMVLSSFSLLSGLVFLPKIISLTGNISAPVAFIGRNSFIIYLSHTIVLRILWGAFFDGTPGLYLIASAALWILAVIMTIRGGELIKPLWTLLGKKIY